MTLPTLFIQYQCTAPSCSRMSSPMNMLYLLPTIEELMSNNTTQIPFVTMRLKPTAEQSCPFCGSPSRILPVDPTFQAADLRSALKITFGSFFGHSGPDILESQSIQWMPVQAPGNETLNITPATRIQWVTVGVQIHQLLIAATPSRDYAPVQISGRGGSQASSARTSSTPEPRTISTPPVQPQPMNIIPGFQSLNMTSQNRLSPYAGSAIARPQSTSSASHQQRQRQSPEVQLAPMYDPLSMIPAPGFTINDEVGQMHMVESSGRQIDPRISDGHMRSWSDLVGRVEVNDNSGENNVETWPPTWPLDA